MEGTAALLIRAAMQRSYTVVGTNCPENVEDLEHVTLTISSAAYSLGVAWVSCQFFINALLLLCCLPYLFVHDPILPAINAAKDDVVFTLYAAKSQTAGRKMKSYKSNFKETDGWKKMELVLRIGENILTADDPERGTVVMDKPEYVTNFADGKLYL